MASSMIHIAIASELNKKLNRDKSKLFIGTISPDISKLIGQDKKITHFLTKEGSELPDLDYFLSKYKDKLYDDFVLGYYIHLYVDYLWFKYFLPKVFDEDKNMITKKDGTIVKCNGKMLLQYIYNDYTNLNTALADDYDLDFKIFYNEIPQIDNIIEEAPVDCLDLIVNTAGKIIEESKITKDMVFDMTDVKIFIDLCVDVIANNLRSLNLI